MVENKGIFFRFGFFAVAAWIFLAIYSYSQVDLNLTLSSQPAYLKFQNFMTNLGYYQRPLSAAIFLLTVSLIFFLYTRLVRLLQKETKFYWSDLLAVIVLIYTIAFLCYPAFSYDIFNYIFDIRIVTKYGLSPYFFRALDFPDDPWTRFMRWTHRYYPYGPVWLALTIVPSYLGQGKFVSTLLFFKLFFIAAAIGNILFVYAIAHELKLRNSLAVAAFFALNPLVVIESVVSPHNEVFLLLLALAALYSLFKNKKIVSVFLLLLSIGVKFVTISFIPVYLLKVLKPKTSSILMLKIALISSIILLMPVVYFREMYAWYFVPILALASFFSHKPVIFWTSLGLSIGTTLRYAPYFYFGHWNYPVPLINTGLTASFIVFGMMVGGLAQGKNKHGKK